MAGVRATKLNFAGYAGHIMLMKIRYGYGVQTHMEKMEILHSWYSDLRARLPVIMKKPEDYTEAKQWNGKTYHEMMKDAEIRLGDARKLYDPVFEGLTTCNPAEKSFMITLCGIKEVLDEITAISQIIDTVQTSDEGFQV